MTLLRTLISCFVLVTLSSPLAASPTVNAPLPELHISDRGELTYQDDDFTFVPWSSTRTPGKVHVIQYFGAKLADRDVFAPVTDRIQETFEAGTVHVTTVLNMDAALWGTSSFVMSELEKNKKQHPASTMVVDEEGSGIETWNLGKDGTGLIVMDADGIVRFFNRGSLSEDQLASTIELIRSNIDS